MIRKRSRISTLRSSTILRSRNHSDLISNDRAMKNTIARNNPPPNPKADGQSHINVHYTYAFTQLGKMLSTYFVLPFEHPYFGPFRCVEGFMLYIRTGCREDAFRKMNGTMAKEFFRAEVKAKRLEDHDVDKDNKMLASAIWAKINSSAELKTLLVESTLPFDSYYLYGVGKVPIRPSDGDALIKVLTTLRDLVKRDEVFVEPTKEEYNSLRIY